MERDINAVYHSISTLEKSVAEQIAGLKQQLHELTKVPLEVEKLKMSSEHHNQNLQRIGESLDGITSNIKEELSEVHDKVEKTTGGLQHVVDRIEQKFTEKIDEIKKELNSLVNDYDKRIAAMKAVAAALSVAFTVLQGIVGLSLSSYVNGWKTRVEENELSIKDIKKGQLSQEVLIRELQQESLRRK